MKRFTEVGLLVIIVGCVLAFGGVQPLVYSLMELSTFVLILVLLVYQSRRGKIDIPFPVIVLPLLFFVVLQLVPLPASVVTLLSPWRAMNVAGLISRGSNASWTTLSIYPHDTEVALLKLLAYCCAFVLAAYSFDWNRKGNILIRGLILLGCIEAVYGIVQYLTGFQKIFTYSKRFYTEEATGTYINRNHFAGLLELTLPLVIASAFYSYQITSESRRSRQARRSNTGSSSARYQAVFYLFLAVVMAVALVFSRSRMGTLAAVVSIVLLGLLAQVRVRRKAWALGILLFLACIVGYGLWIGLDPVLARFERIGEPGYLEMEGRLSIWRDGLRLISSYPLTGTGLGTFGVAFRRFQGSLVEYYVDHAHNDYLELTAELGVFGVALLLIPVFYLWGRMVVKFFGASGRYHRSVLLGCVGSICAMLIHTGADFNLQLPANALIFSVLLGIGYKASRVESTEQRSDLARESSARKAP